jgi:hypothetical protein
MNTPNKKPIKENFTSNSYLNHPWLPPILLVLFIFFIISKYYHKNSTGYSLMIALFNFFMINQILINLSYQVYFQI